MSVQYTSPDFEIGVRNDWLSRRIVRLRERLGKGMVFDSVQVGMRKPVSGEAARRSKLPMTVRPMTAEDVAELLPADTTGLDRQEERDIQMRRQLAELVPECGYAVVDDRSGRVCYLQWFIGSDRNDALAKVEGLPQLAEGEMMIEGAYVPPAYRGRTASFAAATVAIAHAESLGPKALITFVGEEHSVSMRGVHRLGFRPYMLHVRRHLLFGLIEFDRFVDVPPEDSRFDGKF
jgi:RimJ/RimL family protein N-acetyltransferase